uniref:Putative secreted protein n=1 Tax=Anopheles darlingi TaxID=43151 RepID=A0A2M4DI88_ANODA
MLVDSGGLWWVCIDLLRRVALLLSALASGLQQGAHTYTYGALERTAGGYIPGVSFGSNVYRLAGVALGLGCITSWS